MSHSIFDERLKRIHQNGPSVAIIPGQVGEPAPSQERAMKRVNRSMKPKVGSSTIVTALLFGFILGAIAGLIFQHIIGAEVVLGFDWQAELALAEADMWRAGAWGGLMAGTLCLFLTFFSSRNTRKVVACSATYMVTAIGVNAQDLVAIVPPDALEIVMGMITDFTGDLTGNA